MKNAGILLIRFYKIIVPPLLHQLVGVKSACRYDETCSVYAERVIRQYGILYGSQLAIKRILRCQPFTR